MKNSLIILATLFCSASLFAQGGPWLIPPDEVIAHYSRSYIPEGFDNNDNVQVVATGHYQNGCYKKGNTSVHTDAANRRIEINISHYYSPEDQCVMWVQPYKEDVALGVLPEGTYTVLVNGNQTRDTLNVRAATTNQVDDFVYAPVGTVSFERETSTLHLAGFFYDHCARIQEVQIIRQPERNVIIALPIVGFAPDCNAAVETRRLNRWESSVVVDVSGIEESVLFHVRAMNGESKNYVADLR